jgi:hypothetical protein
VNYISIFSTIISFAFAISVFNRYRQRKGTHLLLWGIGQGTVHLLVRKRGVASSLTVVLTIVSLLAAVLVFTAPLTSAAASFDPRVPISTQYKEIMTRGSLTILLTILLNIYGTITLVGGAIYSAYLFWRKKVLLNRVIGNILIAAGAMMPALGGTFIRAGMVDWLYLSEFLGVILMYLGFMQATAKQPVESTPAVTAS